MSEDYSREQVIVLDKFNGQDNYHDPTKIRPDEFTRLVNARTNTGNIEATSGRKTWFYKPLARGSNWNTNVPISELHTVIPVADTSCTKGFMYCHEAFAAHSVITVFLLLKPNDNIEHIIGHIYNGTTNSDIGVSICDSCVAAELGSNNGEPVWVPLRFTPNVDVPFACWIGFEMLGGNTEVYVHPSAAGEIWRDENNNLIYIGANQPCIYIFVGGEKGAGNAKQLSIVDLPLGLPEKEEIVSYSEGNIYGLTGHNRRWNMGANVLVDYSDDTKWASTILYRSGTTIKLPDKVTITDKVIRINSKINIVYDEGIVYIAHESAYCVPIAIVRNTVIHNGKSLKIENLNAVYFNGIIALSGLGATAEDYPCYIDITDYNIGVKSFTSNVVDTIPHGAAFVGVHALSLYFIGDYHDDAPYRLTYMEAGKPDTYGGRENLSLGDAVTNVIEFQDKMIIFFKNYVKELTGAFGQAHLRQIFPLGTTSRRGAVKTPVGIFMLSTDGLYLYTGAWKKIHDFTTLIQTSCGSFTQDVFSKLNVDFLGVLALDRDNDEIIIQLEKLSGANTFFIAYNYLTNKFRMHHSSSAIEVSGSMNVAGREVLLLKSGIADYEVLNNFTFDYYHDPFYEAVEIISGWIDPLPEYRTKIFDRIIIEGTGPDIVLTITLDNGEVPINAVTYSFTGSGAIKRITARIAAEGERFQYKITSAKTTASQLKINRIKVHYMAGELK